MITKERLEELIKEEATVYWVARKSQSIGQIYLPKIEWANEPKDEPNAFETKDQAEHALNYTRIPRTEYLDLPYYEDLENIKEYVMYVFVSKNGDICEIRKLNNKFISLVCDGEYLLYDLPLTKENYTKACEIAKKLWKGERV